MADHDDAGGVSPSLIIDTAFDVRSDSGGGDPDAHSATLRRFHQALWTKPLPDGTRLELEVDPVGYLQHRSARGEFRLSSDSLVHTYSYWQSMAAIIEQVDPTEIHEFDRIASTVGATIVFPSNRVDGRPTINGSRGFSHRIRDRVDLTLECIRRHYAGRPSPLTETLDRYQSFFDLFEAFDGYIGFFLLDDLVDPSGAVRFLLPFDDFRRSAVPTDVVEYQDYMRRAIAFINERNRRIDAWTGISV